MAVEGEAGATVEEVVVAAAAGAAADPRALLPPSAPLQSKALPK
jgi:hypothetical protein